MTKLSSAIEKRIIDIEKNLPEKPTYNTVQPHKLILYLLDIIKSGTFNGVISIKIEDNKIFAPKVEQTEYLDRNKSYDYITND